MDATLPADVANGILNAIAQPHTVYHAAARELGRARVGVVRFARTPHVGVLLRLQLVWPMRLCSGDLGPAHVYLAALPEVWRTLRSVPYAALSLAWGETVEAVLVTLEDPGVCTCH